MTRHTRATEVKTVRKHLATHLEMIHSCGDDAVKNEVIDLLEGLTRCVDYVVDGRVCASVFADCVKRSNLDLDVVPTSHGLVVLTVPYRMSVVESPLAGFMWMLRTGGVRIVPLTYAGHIGLVPADSLAPMMLGYTIDDGADVGADGDSDTRQVTQVVVKLWQSIPGADVTVIGRQGKSGVMITHSRRRRLCPILMVCSGGWGDSHRVRVGRLRRGCTVSRVGTLPTRDRVRNRTLRLWLP